MAQEEKRNNDNSSVFGRPSRREKRIKEDICAGRSTSAQVQKTYGLWQMTLKMEDNLKALNYSSNDYFKLIKFKRAQLFIPQESGKPDKLPALSYPVKIGYNEEKDRQLWEFLVKNFEIIMVKANLRIDSSKLEPLGSYMDRYKSEYVKEYKKKLQKQMHFHGNYDLDQSFEVFAILKIMGSLCKDKFEPYMEFTNEVRIEEIVVRTDLIMYRWPGSHAPAAPAFNGLIKLNEFTDESTNKTKNNNNNTKSKPK